MKKLEKFIKKEEKGSGSRRRRKPESVGQGSRYFDITRRIHDEKLHFAKGMNLRNFDISIAAPSASRKVRRIVEKRMCQAYHRLSHAKGRTESNRRRQDMRKAVSYQLKNLGQIDEVTQRSAGTHWKKAIDKVTGRLVLKPKQSYKTLEEALMVARDYCEHHSGEPLPMTAYKCVYCKKYHIGHGCSSAHSLATI